MCIGEEGLRDLGGMGENAFIGWCLPIGITANKIVYDKTGWDIHVELPWKTATSTPRDMWPAPIESKIQIKSTDKQEKKCAITLSNLHRLIKTQLPTFYCFIEFDGLDNPQAAYLVHVDKEIIERVLKRIRELEVKEEGHLLNKKTITIGYYNEHRLDRPDGQSLKSKIMSYVPKGMEKYIDEKNKLLKTLGFEEGSAQLKVTVTGEQVIKEIVDLTLGLRDTIKVSEFEIKRTRFDIPETEPLAKSKDATLSIKAKPVGKAVVTFKEYKHSPPISFDANIYFSPFNQFIPKNDRRFRIESDFFNMVFQPYSGIAEFSFMIDNSAEYPLSNITKMLRLFTILKKAKGEVIFEMESDGFPKLESKISVSKDFDDYSRIYFIAEEARSLCAKFDILETTHATIADLAKHGKGISQFYHILDLDPKQFDMTFRSDDLSCEESDMVACAFLIRTVIGSKVIVCFIAFIGTIELLDDGRYRLAPQQREIGPNFILPKSENIKQEETEREFERFGDFLEEQGFITVKIDWDS